MKSCMRSYFLNDLFDEFFREFTIDNKVKEQKENYDLVFHVPGLSKDDININIENGYLKIEGENEDEYSVKIKRQFSLPTDVKVDDIKAEVKNGVLKLTIPKKKPKSVAIQIE